MNLLLNVLWEKKSLYCKFSLYVIYHFFVVGMLLNFMRSPFWFGVLFFYAIILIHSFLAMLKQHGQTIYGGFPVVSILVSHRCLLLS